MIDATEVWLRMKKMPKINSSCYLNSFQKKKNKRKKRTFLYYYEIDTRFLFENFVLFSYAIKKGKADPV